LIGGPGADHMAGGLGNDVYGVDNVGDVVTELAGQGFDTVYSSVSFTLPANVEVLFLVEGAGNINGTGNALGNALIGNSGANVLTGGAGDDVYGVNGNIDTVIELPGNGYDEVYSSADYSMTPNVETLFLVGTAINGIGNATNNAIIGDDQNNILQTGDGTFEFINGGNGNDVLIGGHGHDELFGGTGNDMFRFNELADVYNGASNVGDLIIDFTLGQDKIQIYAKNFGLSVVADGGNFFSGTVPTSHLATPTLLYNTASGNLFYDADGTGAGGLVLLAHLANVASIHASDFVLF
jgi:serralysin